MLHVISISNQRDYPCNKTYSSSFISKEEHNYFVDNNLVIELFIYCAIAYNPFYFIDTYTTFISKCNSE